MSVAMFRVGLVRGSLFSMGSQLNELILLSGTDTVSLGDFKVESQPMGTGIHNLFWQFTNQAREGAADFVTAGLGVEDPQ